jgi:hypothetical protein
MYWLEKWNEGRWDGRDFKMRVRYVKFIFSIDWELWKDEDIWETFAFIENRYKSVLSIYDRHFKLQFTPLFTEFHACQSPLFVMILG